MTPDPIDGGSRVCVQTDASDALATMSTSPATAFGEGVRRLRARLGRPLPGRDAVKDVAPSARTFVDADAARAQGSREGGALLLVYPWRGEPHTVLTVRSAALRDHAGQISLPGGRIEAGESPVDAALREAWEELAIGPADLDVLGVLTPIYVPPSHFLVHPVVAARRSRPDLRPHAAEVAEAIEVPIARFLDDAVRRVEIWDIRGERRRVPFFDLEGHKVWGATAMILREFAVVWREAVL
ncbi:CoA pyrophosphatase [bacterium]|nr:MAG: CoA pyrophosphatase [bacterium]